MCFFLTIYNISSYKLTLSVYETLAWFSTYDSYFQGGGAYHIYLVHRRRSVPQRPDSSSNTLLEALHSIPQPPRYRYSCLALAVDHPDSGAVGRDCLGYYRTSPAADNRAVPDTAAAAAVVGSAVVEVVVVGIVVGGLAGSRRNPPAVEEGEAHCRTVQEGPGRAAADSCIPPVPRLLPCHCRHQVLPLYMYFLYMYGYNVG